MGINLGPSNTTHPTQYESTTPASPLSGLTKFTRRRARNLPAFVDPVGQDSRLQPHIITNNAMWLKANNNSTAVHVQGWQVTFRNNATTSPTTVAAASTNFYTSMARFRLATTSSAGTGGSIRMNSVQYFHSTTANMGGFHFIARFGLNTVAAGTRGFMGLSTQAADYSAASNPGTQLNQVGFYWNATDTNLNFISSGSVAGTGVSLGANFPVTTGAATNFYEVAMYSPSASGQYGFWSATRLNDGSFASGSYGSSGLTGSTTIPAIGTMMAGHLYYGNGALASAHSMDVQSMYIETDN